MLYHNHLYHHNLLLDVNVNSFQLTKCNVFVIQLRYAAR